MIVQVRCPQCGNQDDNRFSILGYTNAFKTPPHPAGTVLAIVRCEIRTCQTEFEVLLKVRSS